MLVNNNIFLKNELDTHFYLWKNTESKAELLAILEWNEAEITTFEQEYQSLKSQICYLSSRCLFKKLELQIYKNENGKPFLTKNNSNNNFQISISHTAEYSGLVLSNKKIGLDIEKVSPRL